MERFSLATALLLMGGTGSRFGSETPKQFHRLGGKKLYLHAFERLLHSSLFEEILIVSHPGWIEKVKQDLLAYPDAPVRVIAGGETRQASSYAGLLACHPGTQLVLIHDAARPFVSTEILEKNLEAASLYGAVNTCIPCTDTIVHAPDQKEILSIPTRSEWLRGQTPQTFSYPLILQAHQKGTRNDASDDCSLLLSQGHSVHIVAGSEENLKITSPLDLFLAGQLLRSQQQPLTPISLTGKRIALTGGTGAIGSAIADLLHAHGAIPLQIGRSAPLWRADLTQPSEVASLFKAIGPIDGLINCIGQLKRSRLEHLSPTEIETLIATNLTSIIFCCQSAQIIPGGHLINIASSAYLHGRAELTVYAAAKAALVNFTQGLAEERPELHIHTLVPQRTRTPLRQDHFPEEDPTELLSPETVAAAALSLLTRSSTDSLLELRLS